MAEITHLVSLSALSLVGVQARLTSTVKTTKQQNSMKLTLLPVNGGPFNCLPSREITLDDERILCNDVHLPNRVNYHNVGLWVIGHEFGPVCAVWASCVQDALDEMVDNGLGDCFLVSEEDQKSASEEEQEEWARLGNAGGPADLSNAWIQRVRLDPVKDFDLCIAFAEANGACQKTLWR